MNKILHKPKTKGNLKSSNVCAVPITAPPRTINLSSHI